MNVKLNFNSGLGSSKLRPGKTMTLSAFSVSGDCQPSLETSKMSVSQLGWSRVMAGSSV